MVTSAWSDYFKYPFLLHNHLTCRSVLHADDVDTLLRLSQHLAIRRVYLNILPVILQYVSNTSRICSMYYYVVSRHRLWQICPLKGCVITLWRRLWRNGCSIFICNILIHLVVNHILLTLNVPVIVTSCAGIVAGISLQPENV